MADLAHPEVWRKAFEEHRKEGSKEIELDEASRAEIEAVGDTGGGFRVCVDPKGNVASTKVVFPPGARALAKRVAAATKGWRFEPFLVRGKPAIACSIADVKL